MKRLEAPTGELKCSNPNCIHEGKWLKESQFYKIKNNTTGKSKPHSRCMECMRSIVNERNKKLREGGESEEDHREIEHAGKYIKYLTIKLR